MRNLSRLLSIAIPVLIIGSVLLYKIVIAPHGSTTLSWNAPVQYEDSQPLADLAGYIVHCWTASGKFTNTIYIDDPSVTSYKFEELWPGTYFCAVTALNAEGDESVLSNVVAKTVN